MRSVKAFKLHKSPVKLWRSWSGDSFGIRDADGHPFEADVKGQAISLRDRMILRDQHGKEIGVMLKMFGRVLETFKIYGFEPYMPGQKPSKQCCNGRRLYPWATVVNQAMSVRTRIGSMLVPQQLRLTRNGKVRASAKQKGFFQGITGSTRDLTIGPAIDPCLIVAFVAIVDEIREN